MGCPPFTPLKVWILPWFILGLLASGVVHGQSVDTVRGVVLEEDLKGELRPLTNAHVYWMGTDQGVTTGSLGTFALGTIAITRALVIRYLGLEPDTLYITDFKPLRVIMKPFNQLGLVEISEERASTYIRRADAISTTVLTEAELFKAACCNLSESFETNPSVEVSYTDAVSGVKQIQLLGLSGTYVQMLRENLPTMRGLTSHYGLTLIPGTWLDEIQLTQGPGSAVNGFEGMSGQINLEFKKPNLDEPLLLNGYLNQMGRSEVNAVASTRWSPRWTSALLLHGNRMDGTPDINGDGFMDLPRGHQANGLARLFYNDGQGWTGQINFRRVSDRRNGGQVAFDHSKDFWEQLNLYGLTNRLDQTELFGKVGYVFPAHRYRSLGMLWSLGTTQLNHRYGYRAYTGRQNSGMMQVLYQDVWKESRNRYRVGFQMMSDEYHEEVDRLAIPLGSDARQSFHRLERVPGVFGELTLDRYRQQWVIGARWDDHSLFGGQFSPRLHWKYDVTDKDQLRLGIGRGFRVASVWAENQGALVSSRSLRLVPSQEGTVDRPRSSAYGLHPESSWYAGLHFRHDFRFNYRNASMSLDVQHQEFSGQVVVDFDRDPQALWLYNLQGRSYSRSAQWELHLQPLKRQELRLAYRWQDVQTDYAMPSPTGLPPVTGESRRLQRPMVPTHRAMLNWSYRTKKRWEWDATVQVFGPKRIPNTQANPEGMRMPGFSPWYAVAFGQVTRNFKRASVYLGVENLGDFRQRDLILSAQQPYAPTFDASLVWGPAIERMVYAGFRYRFVPSD